MKKIVILPFLQMPSGHHQTANTLSAYLKEIDNSIQIKKIDIFQYTSRLAEQFTSSLYLKAIKIMPSFYSRLYHFNACRNDKAGKRYLFYELLFLKNMKRLIKQEKPDVLICTHCLPSYLLSLMKKRGHLSIPVINAYTDYFINTVWGTESIDFHLVPSTEMKDFLKIRGVSHEKVAVTGIPVHPHITRKTLPSYNSRSGTQPFRVLVSGGNLGVGSIERIFKQVHFSGKIKYFVLCGKNEALFKKIEQLQCPFLQPISYISCRKEMNELYDQMDVVLSKPGGITVSECLHKELPICLLDALPGQEEQNEKYLLEKKLAIKINIDKLENSLLLFLENELTRKVFQKRLSEHMNQQESIKHVLKKFL
ncbi:MAG TPA: glycosyltransferase [Chondromyces sp.]|nr:glycosyltransferase [Chondromyces sp.]